MLSYSISVTLLSASSASSCMSLNYSSCYIRTQCNYTILLLSTFQNHKNDWSFFRSYSSVSIFPAHENICEKTEISADLLMGRK